MKKRFLKLFVAAASVVLLASSCGTIESILSQAAQLANLANCEYSLKNVSNVSIAGVNLKNVTNGNITAADVLKLAAALKNKQVPLAMDLNVDIKNPTKQQAALTAMDWIMLIDGAQFATGTSTNAHTVAANTTTTVPLNLNTDIYSMFSSNGIESLKNFVKSFNNDGTSSKIGLKIKPSINVGGVEVPMPNYITLEKKTGATGTTSSSSSSSSNSGSNGSSNGGSMSGGKATLK